MTPTHRTPQQRDRRFARVRNLTLAVFVGSGVASVAFVGYAASIPRETTTTSTTTTPTTTTTTSKSTGTTVYSPPTTAPTTTTTVCTTTPSGTTTCY